MTCLNSLNSGCASNFFAAMGGGCVSPGPAFVCTGSIRRSVTGRVFLHPHFAGQFFVSQPPSNDIFHRQREALDIRNLAVIVAKRSSQ